jgi:adenylyltransferase/sulfurtransferase
MAPSCQEAGVLGVLPGIIGVIQATEVVKYLIGIGELLVGRLVYYDALNMSFDEIKMRWNKECPVYGEKPKITSIQEEIYAESCRIW